LSNAKYIIYVSLICKGLVAMFCNNKDNKLFKQSLKMKKLLFAALLIFSVNYSSFSQITVSGSGCSPGACFGGATSIDATYSISGTDGTGRHVYGGPTGTIIIQFSGGEWKIWDCINTTYYTNPNPTTPGPPATGWSTGVGSCAGSPAPTLSGDVILPVELVSFSGEILDFKEIQLSWQTSSEINNERFEIEESQGGLRFQKIGEVEGARRAFEQQDYSFTIANPSNGVLSYRLKQVDFDGQFEYSDVISVDFKGETGQVGQFYPNPSRLGLVMLNYSAKNDAEITTSVVDVTGRLVASQLQQVSSGSNNLSFDFSSLGTGVYIVQFRNEGNLTYRKLIIE
jgi:hypothetical protein